MSAVPAGPASPRSSGPVLALDIGGTKLAVGVMTSSGHLHGALVEPTRREEGPEVVVARLLALGHRAVAEAGLGQVGAVGISCGGPLDASSGILLCPPHLPGWIDIPIGPLAAAEFGVPAFLENDATAGAWGEYRFGAGRGVRSLVYLTISTGVGGGAVLDGRLHRGAAGNGGEFGHIVVRPGGRRCSCGRRGCVEAYVSGTSIAQRAAEAMSGGRASSLSGSTDTANPRAAGPLTAAHVAAAATVGDPLATEIWHETTDLLATAVTDLVNVFEPDLVVLGGGVTRSGEMLLDPVRRAVAAQAMGPAGRAARVLFAALGDAVCVVGAGAVALDHLTESQHKEHAHV